MLAFAPTRPFLNSCQRCSRGHTLRVNDVGSHCHCCNRGHTLRITVMGSHCHCCNKQGTHTAHQRRGLALPLLDQGTHTAYQRHRLALPLLRTHVLRLYKEWFTFCLRSVYILIRSVNLHRFTQESAPDARVTHGT